MSRDSALNSYGSPKGTPCDGCSRLPTEYTPDGMGVDPCLGIIPGVSQACCGNGDIGYAYVVIGGTPGQSCIGRDDYTVLRGQDALEWFAAQGVGPISPKRGI